LSVCDQFSHRLPRGLVAFLELDDNDHPGSRSISTRSGLSHLVIHKSPRDAGHPENIVNFQ
jgi:hypothetical protein